MLKNNTVVKMGIYSSGSSVRVIAECDLITQDNGHKEEAIYLIEVAVMRDPRTPMTDKEVSTWGESVKQNFRDNRFGFKAKDRKEADTFIEYNRKNWNVVREFTEI